MDIKKFSTNNIEAIRKLRERTGLSISKCKSALQVSDFDIDKACSLLYKEISTQSVGSTTCNTDSFFEILEFSISSNNKSFSLIKICCKTDFAARNDLFKNFAKKLSLLVLQFEIISYQELLNCSSDIVKNFLTVELRLLERQLKEAIVLRDIFYYKNLIGFLGFYKHINCGVITTVSFVYISRNNLLIANDLAAHIVFMKLELQNKVYVNKQEKIDGLLKQSYIFFPEKTVGEFLLDNNLTILDFFLFFIT